VSTLESRNAIRENRTILHRQKQKLTSGARAAARSMGNESSVVDGAGNATLVGRNPYLAAKSTSDPAVMEGPVVLADQVQDI
jgi:hypothetical protein